MLFVWERTHRLTFKHIFSPYSGISSHSFGRSYKWAREQQEAEAKAPGGVATRWGLRCWATQQSTKQEGCKERLRHDEWRWPRRRAEARREGDAGSAVVRKNSSLIYKKTPSENLRSVGLSFLPRQKPVYLFLTWTVLFCCLTSFSSHGFGFN